MASSVTAKFIQSQLHEFGFKSVELNFDERSAIVQLSSREDALKAVVHCRQRKQQLPFRAAMPTSKDKQSETAAQPRKKPEAAPASVPTEAPPASAQQARPRSSPEQPQKAPSKSTSFDDWEAD